METLRVNQAQAHTLSVHVHSEQTFMARLIVYCLGKFVLCETEAMRVN